MWCVLVLFLCISVSTKGQDIFFTPPPTVPPNLQNELSQRIGIFASELLYYSSRLRAKDQNLVVSPLTVWTVLAVISEGATETTADQINNALKVSPTHRNATRIAFGEIFKWLRINTSTVELINLNNAFVDEKQLLLKEFQSLASSVYNTRAVAMNFKDFERTATIINEALSQATRGRIRKLIEPGDLQGTKLILTSALYFKGQWTFPFKPSVTTTMPFHDSNNTPIGLVNMMYSRQKYAMADVRALQARVIELPYGDTNRLSMLVMMPNPGVSIENMFLNFVKIPLDALFKELSFSKDESGEVDCFIPRFKIESDLDMSNVLKTMGIVDLFDEFKAKLPLMSVMPLYVSKVIHKAEIEVNEEGTTASAITATEFSNRIGVVLQFIANRPFSYLIVEKTTNTILFGGIYSQPSLY